MKFTMAVDYYDLVAFSDELFDEERIDRFFGECVENGINAVQWRVSVCGKLLYHTATPDVFAVGYPPVIPPAYEALHRPIYEKCERIMELFDPLEVAVDKARKHGLEIFPWLTLYDDYGYGINVSSLMSEHPEFSWSSRDGRRCLGLTSYVYPEVVDFRMRQIRELMGYGGDGLYLSNRSHSRPPEYFSALDEFIDDNPGEEYTEWSKENRELIAEMLRDAAGSFGFDPPAIELFRSETGLAPEDDPERWWLFRGRYFSDFISQVSLEVKKYRRKLAFGLRYGDSNPLIYGRNFFNWKALDDDRVFDELHYLFPGDDEKERNALFDEASSSKSLSYAWLWLGNITDDIEENINVAAVLKAIDSGCVDGVALFEAYRFDLEPRLWELTKILGGR